MSQTIRVPPSRRRAPARPRLAGCRWELCAVAQSPANPQQLIHPSTLLDAQPQPITRGIGQILLDTEVAFGGGDAGLAERQLDPGDPRQRYDPERCHGRRGAYAASLTVCSRPARILDLVDDDGAVG